MSDTVTFWVWFGMWPVWFVTEMLILFLDARGADLDTLSQVARKRGYQFSSVVYTWCGLASHFWWWRDRWASWWPAFTFWLICLGLLVWDLCTIKRHARDLAFWPTWERRVRKPLYWMIIGIFAGHFLFPQASL